MVVVIGLLYTQIIAMVADYNTSVMTTTLVCMYVPTSMYICTVCICIHYYGE